MNGNRESGIGNREKRETGNAKWETKDLVSPLEPSPNHRPSTSTLDPFPCSRFPFPAHQFPIPNSLFPIPDNPPHQTYRFNSIARHRVFGAADRARIGGSRARHAPRACGSRPRAAPRKRGGGAAAITLDENVSSGAPGMDVLDLDEALERLAAFDERKARAIELHYFGGLEYAEVSQALGISEATVHRDLRMSRAWLHRELGDTNDA